jgi:hypothetical protein
VCCVSEWEWEWEREREREQCLYGRGLCMCDLYVGGGQQLGRWARQKDMGPGPIRARSLIPPNSHPPPLAGAIRTLRNSGPLPCGLRNILAYLCPPKS